MREWLCWQSYITIVGYDGHLGHNLESKYGELSSMRICLKCVGRVVMKEGRVVSRMWDELSLRATCFRTSCL